MIEDGQADQRHRGGPRGPRRRRESNDQGEWPCSSCGEFKQRSSFGFEKSRKGGIASCCPTPVYHGALAEVLDSASHRKRLFDLTLEDMIDLLKIRLASASTQDEW